MDDQIATLGHNMGPPYDPDLYERLAARNAELADAGGAWLDKGTIDSEEQAQALVDALAQIKKQAKVIEDQRKAAKEPYKRAGDQVDEAFKRLAAPIKTLTDRLGSLLTAYQVEKQRRLDAERKEREAAERARAEEARKAAEEAARRNDVIGQAEAQAAAVEAEKAAAQAAKAERARVESATGGARTAALRTYYKAAFDPDLPRDVARVRAFNALSRHAAPAEKLDDLLLQLAEAAKRHANGPDEVAGIQFTPVQKAV